MLKDWQGLSWKLCLTWPELLRFFHDHCTDLKGTYCYTSVDMSGCLQPSYKPSGTFITFSYILFFKYHLIWHKTCKVPGCSQLKHVMAWASLISVWHSASDFRSEENLWKASISYDVLWASRGKMISQVPKASANFHLTQLWSTCEKQGTVLASWGVPRWRRQAPCPQGVYSLEEGVSS